MMWVVVALVTVLMLMAGSARQAGTGQVAEPGGNVGRNSFAASFSIRWGKGGMKFFPLVATLFLFILFCNLIGLIPGTYTVTSQIVVTAVFAIVCVWAQSGHGLCLPWGQVPRHS